MMAITGWLKSTYLAISGIALSFIGIILTVIGTSKIKNVFKELNVYFFSVVILIDFSVIFANNILFYIGLVLFLMMILLYFILLFVEEKKTKKMKR